jgi:histidine triad (HIT) family protein
MRPNDLHSQPMSKLARILKANYEVTQAAFLFAGSDIAHAHAHVVPMVAPTDITSRHHIAEETITFQPIARPTDDELGWVALTLKEAIKGKGS